MSMNLIREVPQAAKNLINNRSGPTLTTQKPQTLNLNPVSVPSSSASLAQLQLQSQSQSQSQPQPLLQTQYVYSPGYAGYATPIMIPYGTPYFYNGTSYYQPITYPQFQPAFVATFPMPAFSSIQQPEQQVGGQHTTRRNYERSDKNQSSNRGSSLVDDRVLSTMKQFGYGTVANVHPGKARGTQERSHERNSQSRDRDTVHSLHREKRGQFLDVHMGVPQLYENIQLSFEATQSCRVSWLNRMLAKCNTESEFEKALDIYKLYQKRVVETTPETGTLLIKAACRAGAPERALKLLGDIDNIRLWPTLGGIHYLMISFSLKKDTKSVMQAYEYTKARMLKPTNRTYHILIRECVDNEMVEEALKFAEECKYSNIVPNRVTYNILMNGCRKINKPKDILSLRMQMNGHNIEINDTTVKFTALAHMMLGDTDEAVAEFLSYKDIHTKMEEFSTKFFEVTAEESSPEFADSESPSSSGSISSSLPPLSSSALHSIDALPYQKKCVVGLFNALKAKGVRLPTSIDAKVKQLETELKNLKQ